MSSDKTLEYGAQTLSTLVTLGPIIRICHLLDKDPYLKNYSI